MKKKLFVSLITLLMPAMMMAQFPSGRSAKGTIHLTAQGNEIFCVYVDGQPYGDLAQTGSLRQYTISNLLQGLHDITVRLVRPVDRVAHVSVEYSYSEHQDYVVSYDPMEDRLRILMPDGSVMPTPYTPATTSGIIMPPANNGHSKPHGDQHDIHDNNNQHYRGHHHAMDKDVQDVIARMNKTSFTSDKMNLAKTFVKSNAVQTRHAIDMAKVFSFDSDKLEFLLYAYRYCVDPENYYKATDVLTFSSSKKELLKAIK